MLTILSPAKNMRPVQHEDISVTTPLFAQEAAILAKQLRHYSPWQLESMMKINPQLALRAFENFQLFDDRCPGFPAALSYDGLAYRNLAAHEFSSADLEFAQHTLRILSAFYGVLRPLDGIQSYRLDFMCPIPLAQKNLYAYWGDSLYRALFSTGKAVINLSSAEYAKAVLPYLSVKDTLITCNFLVWKRGRWQMTATSAKIARGQMARYIIKNRLMHPGQLKSFDWNGYTYAPEFSSDFVYTFLQRADKN